MAVVDLEEVPKKVRDLYNKGFAAFERGNLDYAIDMFLMVLDLEPRLLIARKYLRAAEVKQCKEKKVNHQMSSIKGTFTKAGLKGALKKDPKKALAAGEKLLRMDPLNPEFALAYAEAASAADIPEAGVQILDIVKDHHPENIDILREVADQLIITREPQRAREIFDRMISLRPNDQEIQKAMRDAAAMETVTTGSWDTQEDYRKILKDESAATELEQEQRSQKSGGDIDQLIASALAKIQRDPENVNFYRGLADLYTKAERYDEALEELEKARELSGGADPQIDLAISNVTLTIYNHNIKVHEENGDAEQAAAVTQERDAFRMEDAAAKVKRYPNDLKFKFDFGVMLFDAGEINEAVGQFQRAQTNPERRIESLYYLGRCFLAKDQFDIALEQLEKANKELLIMDDNKKRVLYELGQTAEKMADIPKALEYYKAIYAVDIGYLDVSDKVESGLKG